MPSRLSSPLIVYSFQYSLVLLACIPCQITILVHLPVSNCRRWTILTTFHLVLNWHHFSFWPMQFPIYLFFLFFFYFFVILVLINSSIVILVAFIWFLMLLDSPMSVTFTHRIIMWCLQWHKKLPFNYKTVMHYTCALEKSSEKESNAY